MAKKGTTRRLLCAAVTLACAESIAGVSRAHAQGSTVVMGGRLGSPTDAAVGSEEENYLRLLQVAGLAAQRPWSVRPFGPGELRGLVAPGARHPWAARMQNDTTRERRRGALRVASVGAVTGLAVNTGFPFSMNDGGIWAGRGPTAYARAGGIAEWTPATWASLSVRAEPLVFWSANMSTSLANNGLTGTARFADALEPTLIDAPQRFGTRPYARGDLGQSTARADVLGLAVGFSTANQWWGPTLTDPQVLGDNAAGFPYVFVGTSRPVNVGVGTVHVRTEVGRLSQSAYSPMPPAQAYRTAAGAAGVVTIRGISGLELGGSRFFHEAWTGASDALSHVRDPFGRLFGSAYTDNSSNQLASLFGRWVFVPAHVEVWGEYLRNDAAADARDLTVEPDHDVGYTVGARRVFVTPGGALSAVRVEWLNDQITSLQNVRLQVRPYQHTVYRQGHTNLGQTLGSAYGQGGSSVTVGYDRYVPNGRWTFEGARRVVQSSLTYDAPLNHWDVLYYLRAERLRFGRRRDLFLGAAVMPELNRNFGGDALNLRLDGGYRF